jgi:uncharacterized protein YkwD
LLVLGALFALLGPTSAATAQSCPSGPATRDSVICELNAVRAAEGQAPLRQRVSLTTAARDHARDMVVRSDFAHDNPEGIGPAGRARRAGYMNAARRWRIGEVLLWSRGTEVTAAAAVQAWLNRPGHRRIILTPAYRDAGVGLADGAPVGDPSSTPALTISVVVGRRRG